MKEPPKKNATKATEPKARPWVRPRGGEAKMIADLMPEIGRAAFRRFGFVQSSIVTRWREIVGERYADVSMPQSIRFPAGKRAEGTLILTVSGAHATLIQHVVPEIVERVNRFFGYGAVARVKIVQGDVPKPRVIDRPAPPPNLKPVPFELGQDLKEIGDPELAAVLESLARQIAHSEKK